MSPPRHPERFRLEYGLLIIGDQRVHGGSMDRQEAKDAAHECRRHGRLSHDPSPPCGCFYGEGLGVIDGDGPTTADSPTRKAA